MFALGMTDLSLATVASFGAAALSWASHFSFVMVCWPFQVIAHGLGRRFAGVIVERVYLSIGSNLEPAQHIAAALAELHERFGNVEVSPLYRSKAVGFDGPDFINAAIALDTDWEPERLNAWLHVLEDRQGRQRDQPRYSSRTLDIDIVLFGNRVLTGAGNLQVPRNELQYAFVLRPLLDLAPDLRNPATGERLDQFWPTADAESIDRISGF